LNHNKSKKEDEQLRGVKHLYNNFHIYRWTDMNKFICFSVVALLIPSIFFLQNISGEEKNLAENITQHIETSSLNQYGDGYRYNIKGWVYAHIEGDAYERGYQHGYLLSDEIIDMMTRWSNIIHNHPYIKPLNGLFSQQKYEKISKIWWEFCKSQAVRMYWDEYPTEYREEIKGIAAGVTSNGGTIHGDPVSYEDVLTSNQMYEIMSKLTDRKIRKGFHPLLTLFNSLKPEISSYATLSADQFINEFSNQPMHHHCSSFIATGNATTDGQIIISNSMWSSSDGSGAFWWSNYIAIRWNVVLDVTPTQGNRFMMTCAPGYIWSNHDFYQNDAGIVFIETTLPQGIWSEHGLPLAVRARTAVQYAESIDDVIYYLKHENDGVMNAIWLIGDTKTGEIARYELGLYHDAIVDRTFNGFQWSANNPMDTGVRLEKIDLRLLAKTLIYHVVLGIEGYQYHTPLYRPAERDIKFQELGEQYYGEIDVDMVKEIMATDPIGRYSPDCKITSSKLVENRGMWVFTGNPMGKILELENLDQSSMQKEKIKPVGWVRLYGLPDKEGYETINQPQELENQPNILWTHQTGNDSNDFYSSAIIVDDTLFSTTSSGEIYALDTNDGSTLWSKIIGYQPTTPAIYENKLFVGTSEGLKMLDLGWMTQGEKQIGKVVSCPVTVDGNIFVGNEDGTIYAYDVESGIEQWSRELPGEVYISQPWDNSLFVGSGKDCYAINIDTGNLEWIFETDGLITSRPYVDNGTVYFGSWDTYIYAINANDGTLKWKYETGWGVETTPVVSDGLVFVGSNDNNFYALYQNNGALNWFFTCKSGIHSSPVVNEANVIFGSDDGRLYMLNKNTGDIQWNFSPGDTIDDRINYRTTAIISDPVLDDEAVFIGADGNIYALPT